TEGDIAARRIGWGEGEEGVLPCAVGDARGLEGQSVGRGEQGRDDLHGGQVAREPHIAEGGGDDERGGQQGQDHPRAEEEIALADFVLLSLGDAPLASRAEDGSDLGHWSYLTTK